MIPAQVKSFFPYPMPRPGQSLMIKTIFNHIKNKNYNILIEAANGIGKTITILSSLLPIITKENLTLIYVTRTHSQMERVMEELSQINENRNKEIVGISLKGRTQMCLNPLLKNANASEIIDLCSKLRSDKNCDYYLNLKDIKITPQLSDSEEFIQIGKENEICPYYLTKQVLKNADVIITTYNYLVYPFIRSIFFDDIEKHISDCIIVFDEGHNLINVAKDAGVSSLTSNSLKRALKELIGILLVDDKRIIKLYENLIEFLDKYEAFNPQQKEKIELGIKKEKILDLFSHIPEDQISTIFNEIVDMGKRIKELMLENHKLPRSSLYHSSKFLSFLFNNINSQEYLRYILIEKIHDRINTSLLIKSLDITKILSELFESRNMVVISGTLSPISAFMDITGFPKENTIKRVFPSPFPFNNVKIYGIKGITLKYDNRTEATYNLITKICIEIAVNTPYNTGIFCASYGVLQGLLESNLRQKLNSHEIEVFTESRDFSSSDNEKMIKQYKTLPEKKRKAVLIGVSGGRNSEGVDFPGNEMNSIVIVGIPLSKISYTSKMTIKYYQKLFGEDKGLEYAYFISALRKANQAAGRPIRRLKDKGIIFLLDERFFYKRYYKFLSNWIKDRVITLNDLKYKSEQNNNFEKIIGMIVRRFYNK
ncbi:MAG: hypothetical protein GF329_16170 [Candidatus Lokiarchaeota archaeon]|nr:hypothetical protein [Candidatus Lokiarchaeota archaeon]